jgi:hypothetical protein
VLLRHCVQVETFVESEEIKGAVRSSVPGMGHRKSLHKVRSNLIAKVRNVLCMCQVYSIANSLFSEARKQEFNCC